MQRSLSVIIPNYNNGRYLPKCLDSVLMQTYPVREIIVFDDASTDLSKEILKDYEKRYPAIKAIYSNENVGVSIARDTAIKKVTADYVTMLDADDFYWDQDKLAREMDLVNDTQEQICTFSQTIKVDEKGIPYRAVTHRHIGRFVRWKTVTRLYGIYAPRDYCFPKQIYLELGGYVPDMNLYEDWELNLRLMSECRFIYSGGYGTAYRQKEGGLSGADAKRHLEAKKRAFSNNKKRLRYTVFEKAVFYSLLYFNYLRKVIRAEK